MAFVTITFAGKSEKVELLEDSYKIGRSGDNDIIIEDKQCSRQHCEIVRIDKGFKIVDRESKNGTRVNGNLVNQHLLRNKDKIEIGRAILIFEEDSEDATQEMPVRHIEKAVAQKVTARPLRRRKIRISTSSPYSSYITMLTIFIILIVVILIVYQMTKKEPDPTRRLYEEAEKLFKEGKYAEARDKYKLVLAKGESTPYYKGAKDGVEQCDLLLSRKTDSSPSSEDLEYKKIVDYMKKNPKDIEKVKDLYNDFKTKFPTSRYLKQLEKEIFRTSDNEEQAKRDLEELKSEVKYLVSNKSFSSAINSIQKKIGEYVTTSVYKDFEKLLEDTIRKAEDYISEMEKEARKLIDEKKYEEAKKVYEEIIRNINNCEALDVRKIAIQKQLDDLKKLMEKLEK